MSPCRSPRTSSPIDDTVSSQHGQSSNWAGAAMALNFLIIHDPFPIGRFVFPASALTRGEHCREESDRTAAAT